MRKLVEIRIGTEADVKSGSAGLFDCYSTIRSVDFILHKTLADTYYQSNPDRCCVGITIKEQKANGLHFEWRTTKRMLLNYHAKEARDAD